MSFHNDGNRHSSDYLHRVRGPVCFHRSSRDVPPVDERQHGTRALQAGCVSFLIYFVKNVRFLLTLFRDSLLLIFDPTGVECGGHAWSADSGATWTNLTVGAFGPYITLADGTAMANAYAERPLVTMNADGSPHALYLGMGRSSYHDSCNWPQLFCTEEALAHGVKCGPTITPPPPPPATPGHQLVNANGANAKRCLGFDYNRWPCHGFGGNATCATTMLPCADASGDPNPATIWDAAPVAQTGAQSTKLSTSHKNRVAEYWHGSCTRARPGTADGLLPNSQTENRGGFRQPAYLETFDDLLPGCTAEH